MILVSFVIPVFNAEKHLKKCLNSIIAQDLQIGSFEVIVVNDGSTDSSLEIIEQFSCKIQNLKIINQKNKGVSFARNEGLRVANGKYVFFIDADDFLTKNVLKEITDSIENSKADAIGFSFNYIKNSNTQYFNRGNDLQVPLSGINWARIFVKELYYTPTFLFNRQKLIKNNLKFNHKVTVWEDVLFLTQFFCLAKAVHYLDRPLYNYVLYPDSSSQKKVYRTPANRFFILLNLVQFYCVRKLDKTQRKYIRNRISLWFVLLTDTLTRYVFSKWLTRVKDRINARM